jgi:hypothetical protein
MNVDNTTKFSINYSKTKPLQLKSLEENYKPKNEDVQHNYNPFRIQKLQNYNPIYSEFFEMTPKNYDTIGLNHKYHIRDLDTIINEETKEKLNKQVFIKYSPVLDPLKYMIGRYDMTNSKPTTLPDLSLDKEKTLPKLIDYNNASYVDNFFCYLMSKMLHTHNVPHCTDYYGSFLGVQEKFKMNIADDLEYLNASSYFNENLGKLFEVVDGPKNDYTNFGSRGNKNKLHISARNPEDLPVIQIDNLNELAEIALETLDINLDDNLVYENKKKSKHTNSETSSSSNSSNNSEVNYSSDDNSLSGSSVNEDEEDDEDYETCSSNDEDGSDENSNRSFDENIPVYIHNFPVQLICLEKCHGTMDELFIKNKITTENASSMLIQVIFTLLILQNCFYFTHNDLHTNNIMFVETSQEFLYYKFNNKYYKVPTYGKIFKVIDFGRSIYRFQGKQFCSDSFAPGGDAASQYNFEPFMNKKKPRLEANYSFDLSRLGTSIYDFVIDEDNPGKMSALQETIHRWCTDDNGKNLLYKKNGDERYPNFKLYKMIVRTVHKHTPENQLKFEYFNQYETKEPVSKSSVIDIDALPVYA